MEANAAFMTILAGAIAPRMGRSVLRSLGLRWPGIERPGLEDKSLRAIASTPIPPVFKSDYTCVHAEQMLGLVSSIGISSTSLSSVPISPDGIRLQRLGSLLGKNRDVHTYEVYRGRLLEKEQRGYTISN